MARMIPPDCPPDTPTGEAILFNKLRTDPGTEGWIVLHSLELRKHRTKSEGEIDMVILAPGLGVLCLEVKGCDVSRRDGLWIYPYGTSAEGPFRQASRAMHSLRDYVQARDSSLENLLFFSAVAFTRIDFGEDSPEWHSWQIINSLTLARMPISLIVSRIFDRAHQHISSRPVCRSWYDACRSRPTHDQVRRMAGLLRGNFECFVQPRSDVQHIEESLLRLTQEQYDALDAIQDNERVVVKGLAGTGKTFLVMEAARRAVAEGKRTLVLCFNRLLGDWMRVSMNAALGDSGRLLRCQHLHGLMREVVGDRLKVRNDQQFWSNDLPAAVIERLLGDSCTLPQFDVLLVDEAQDLLTDDYMDVLDLLVAGGLAGGQWALFGDFERQAIYLSGGAQTASDMLVALRSRAPAHANFTLRINCRNAGPIAEILTLACSIKPGYSRFLHDMDGASVNPRFWSDGQGQQRLLDDALSELRKALDPEEIAVLSLSADEKSCAAELPAGGRNRLVPFREVGRSQKGCVRYASVHAFKGLEAAGVVITDIERMDEHARALLYVGMSRARVRLVLLMHEDCRAEYDRMLEAGLALTTGM
ncbi:MAG: NERD domain-containing protein [Proteobacteria bacterium]|nr:NERD domain-containing protein [Pseudomonadota bacterium]